MPAVIQLPACACGACASAHTRLLTNDKRTSDVYCGTALHASDACALCAALRGLAHSGAAARVRGHVDRADFDAVNREVRADVVEDAARSEPLGYAH